MGLDLSRPDARHPVSVFQPSRCHPAAPLTQQRPRPERTYVTPARAPDPQPNQSNSDQSGKRSIAEDYSSDAGTPTPRMIGSLPEGTDAGLAAAGALAS